MAQRAFRFRLQKLLDVRELRVKQEQGTLQRLRLAVTEEQRKLQALNDREHAIIDEMRAKPGENFDPEARYARERWLVELSRQQQSQLFRLGEAERAVTKQEEVVRLARQDVKVLERLQEKQREEFHQEVLREQAVLLDDLAAQQFLREEGERDRRTAEAQQRAREESEAAASNESAGGTRR